MELESVKHQSLIMTMITQMVAESTITIVAITHNHHLMNVYALSMIRLTSSLGLLSFLHG